MSANNKDSGTFIIDSGIVNDSKDYMSDIVPKEQQERSKELAENHVDWLLNIMRPLLLAEFIHGYRHGFEESNILACKEDLDEPM